MKNTLAIITVIYNNYLVLEDFFSSLNQQTNKNFKVFITNLSENKKSINYHNVEVLSAKNLGYGFGVNQGLKRSIKKGYSNFVIVNSDIIFSKDFVEECFQSLKKYSKSIIGGKIYYAPGYEYYKKYKKNELGKVIWYAGGYIDWKNVVTPHLGVDQVDKEEFNQLREVDFITGCLMVFNKTILDIVGFFDEKYFLYYEDADYCIRAKKAGIKLIYNPKIIIWHKNAQSTQGSGSIIHQKYQEKNRLIFGLKYAPLKIKILLIKNWFFSKVKLR